MFNRKTLFVLGAGASAEIGFPVGSELATKISERLKRFSHSDLDSTKPSDPDLYQSFLRLKDQRMNDYRRAAEIISRGIHLSRSIDDFLDLHKDDPAVTSLGKGAIVRSILVAERLSRLNYDRSNIYNKPDLASVTETWFAKFMQVLSAGQQNPDALFDNVSFIVFNYDRCLEHFLLHGMEALYGMERAAARAAVRKATIIHPYGAIADYRPLTDSEGLEYGDPDTNYAGCARNIKTYTEQQSEGDDVETMRLLVSEAECIIFLGFHFHPPNMRLLTPSDKGEAVPVYATAFGMSDDDAKITESQIVSLFKEGSNTWVRIRNDLTCTQLFDAYSKSIAGQTRA